MSKELEMLQRRNMHGIKEYMQLRDVAERGRVLPPTMRSSVQQRRDVCPRTGTGATPRVRLPISMGRGGLLEPQTNGIANHIAKQKPEHESQRLAKCVAV